MVDLNVFANMNEDEDPIKEIFFTIGTKIYNVHCSFLHNFLINNASFKRRSFSLTMITVANPGFPKGGCANLLFGKNFAENCMKFIAEA